MQSFKEHDEICKFCEHDPCICDDSHGFVTETKRMSAAVKLQRAFEREQLKTKSRLATGKEQDDAWERTKKNLEKPENMAVLKRLKNEGYNGYDDNRTGFAKKPREDDEGHGSPNKPFRKDFTNDRPHTVHIDGKKWKTFTNGHQANAAAKTLESKGKKVTVMGHYKEQIEEGKMGEKAAGDLDYHPTVKKEKPPFDGPYTKKQSATPGKYGSGYSTARHLARQAMEKFKKKPTQGSLKESRKAEIVKQASKDAKKKAKDSNTFQPEPTLDSEIIKTNN